MERDQSRFKVLSDTGPLLAKRQRKTYEYKYLIRFARKSLQTTRAYLHPEEDVRAALKAAGFKIQREEFTGTNFYFSKLLEATK